MHAIDIEDGNIDIAYEISKERLDFESDYYKQLDSRFATLLSVAAIVITVFVGLVEKPLVSPSTANAPGIVASCAILLLVFTIGLFFYGFVFSRNFKNAPDPDALINNYMDLDSKIIRFEIAKSRVEAWKQVKELINKRVKLLRTGTVTFLISTILIIIYMYV